METLIYAANSLYVVAYFTTDMLRLRLLTVTAASCLATYFYSLPEPLLTVVGWNLFFIALNLMQIARLIHARRACERGSGARTSAGPARSKSRPEAGRAPAPAPGLSAALRPAPGE